VPAGTRLSYVSGRRSVADARETRALILRRAADIGSVDGLEAVTIGRLAGDLEMSKAGVLGQFGSKEELQLATVDLAAEIFRANVWDPVAGKTPGIERLLAICDTWTSYAESPPFPGGCFIATSSFEYASREGRVHEAVAAAVQLWHVTLVADIVRAVEDGALPDGADPEQLAFTIEALASAIKPAAQLRGDHRAAERALHAMRTALGVAEDPAPGVPAPYADPTPAPSAGRRPRDRR